MSGTDPRVDAYIAAAPEARRPALAQLRALCRTELPGCDESLECGMPAYIRAGTVKVAFANRARYVSLHILRTDLLDGARPALAGCDLGKGCVHSRCPEQIDTAIVRDLLRRTVTATGAVC